MNLPQQGNEKFYNFPQTLCLPDRLGGGLVFKVIEECVEIRDKGEEDIYHLVRLLDAGVECVDAYSLVDLRCFC